MLYLNFLRPVYLHLNNLDDLQPDETEVKGIVPSPRYENGEVGAWSLRWMSNGVMFVFLYTGFGVMTNMVSLRDNSFSYSMHQLLVHHLSGPEDDRALIQLKDSSGRHRLRIGEN
ncbi:hypothetical protein TNCV_4579461 [Trichonephila clavipes]|nr:hypothetical protein TNCV_4579461 [Trichonephila clavipes]